MPLRSDPASGLVFLPLLGLAPKEGGGMGCWSTCSCFFVFCILRLSLNRLSRCRLGSPPSNDLTFSSEAVITTSQEVSVGSLKMLQFYFHLSPFAFLFFLIKFSSIVYKTNFSFSLSTFVLPHLSPQIPLTLKCLKLT